MLHRGEVSTNRGESNALVPHGTAGTLAGVLDSLKQARLMLQKQIARVPKSDHGPRRNTTEQSLLKPEPGNNADVPGGLSGLFRPPTDMSLTNTSKGYVPLPGNQSSLAGFYPGDRDVLPAVHPSTRNHYRASNPGSPIDDRLISGQFINAGTRTMSLNPGMSRYQDINAHAHSHYHPYPDAMPGMLSRDRTHRPTPTSGTAPPVSRLDPLMYNENLYTRSPMYRH
ncbi:hypothetical protein MLD38_038050 [Melastoma candidum]|nr:hypothetical protein MLD38_038050 [Melastoma candidum]